jgi:cytochrome b pre-mRNA-processing protein 3
MFARFFHRRSGRRLVDRFHGDIVAAARQPAFYLECGVPDTFEGRFEILILHVSATVRRLDAVADPGRAMAQELTDSMFEHLDIALREIGVTDLGVPKRMKKLAEAYFGRAAAYAAALSEDGDGRLAEVVARNIYGGELAASDPRVGALARYARALETALSQTPAASLFEGLVAFPKADEAMRGLS